MEVVSYKVVLIATATGIIPLAAWLFFMYQKGPLRILGVNFLILIFFVGVLTAIPASLLEIFFIESDGGNIIANAIRKLWLEPNLTLLSPDFMILASAAAIEEVSKGLGILFLSFKKKEVFRNGGLLIGILVGLSFAITENGVYFATVMNNQMESLGQVITLRFIVSTTAHVIYSGLMGYYLYGLFSGPNGKLKFLIGALTVPFFIHLLFNYLLGTVLSWCVILIIFVGIFILYKLYQKNKQLA